MHAGRARAGNVDCSTAILVGVCHHWGMSVCVILVLQSQLLSPPVQQALTTQAIVSSEQGTPASTGQSPDAQSCLHTIRDLLQDHGQFVGHLLRDDVLPGRIECMAARGSTSCVKYGSFRHGDEGVLLIPALVGTLTRQDTVSAAV